MKKLLLIALLFVAAFSSANAQTEEYITIGINGGVVNNINGFRQDPEEEDPIVKEYKNGMTKADMEELKSTYLTAIRACNIYLENQGSRIKAWEGRKTLVREMRERLKSEVALVRLGTILYEQEESDEKLKKGADLISRK